MPRKPPRIHPRLQDPLHVRLIPRPARLQELQEPNSGALILSLQLHQQPQRGQRAAVREALFRHSDPEPRRLAGDGRRAAHQVQPRAAGAEAQGLRVPGVGLQEQFHDRDAAAGDGGVEAVAPEVEGKGGGVVKEAVEERESPA